MQSPKLLERLFASATVVAGLLFFLGYYGVRYKLTFENGYFGSPFSFLDANDFLMAGAHFLSLRVMEITIGATLALVLREKTKKSGARWLPLCSSIAVAMILLVAQVRTACTFYVARISGSASTILLSFVSTAILTESFSLTPTLLKSRYWRYVCIGLVVYCLFRILPMLYPLSILPQTKAEIAYTNATAPDTAWILAERGSFLAVAEAREEKEAREGEVDFIPTSTIRRIDAFQLSHRRSGWFFWEESPGTRSSGFAHAWGSAVKHCTSQRK